VSSIFLIHCIPDVTPILKEVYDQEIAKLDEIGQVGNLCKKITAIKVNIGLNKLRKKGMKLR
jgi:hypothetical protein